MDGEIADTEVIIPDFSLTRLDRNRHGGGIAFYTKSNLFSKVIFKGPYDLEFVLFSVSSLNFSYKVHFGLFYRPPSSPSCVFDFLYSSLQTANIHTFSSFVLLGDFNVNVNNPSHPCFNDLCNIIMNSFLMCK